MVCWSPSLSGRLSRAEGKALLADSARSSGPQEMKGKNMNEQDRVLIRKGARELNAQEVEKVGGGFNTLAITFGPHGRDGDGLPGEA